MTDDAPTPTLLACLDRLPDTQRLTAGDVTLTAAEWRKIVRIAAETMQVACRQEGPVLRWQNPTTGVEQTLVLVD